MPELTSISELNALIEEGFDLRLKRLDKAEGRQARSCSAIWTFEVIGSGKTLLIMAPNRIASEQARAISTHIIEEE